jgi:hypothetical protein
MLGSEKRSSSHLEREVTSPDALSHPVSSARKLAGKIALRVRLKPSS